MTIKDLTKNEELVNTLVEEIDDFEDTTEVVYEVWAFGYDENDEITDAELCMFTSNDLEEAIAYAKKVELGDVVNLMPEEPCTDCNICKITVEVETVIQDCEGEFMNAGTIYTKVVWEADNPEEDDDDDCNLVVLQPDEYEVLEDNTLKVRCRTLKYFNKNDIILVDLVGITETFPMEYKIVSKVIYEDGDYFHCELTY